MGEKKFIPVVLLLTTSFFAISCDGGIDVRGFVHSGSGAAISNAHIFLEHGDWPNFKVDTDSAGCFEVGGVVPVGKFNYSLRIEADGYQTFLTEVSNKDREALSIVLASKGSPDRGRSVKTSHIPCP